MLQRGLHPSWRLVQLTVGVLVAATVALALAASLAPAAAEAYTRRKACYDGSSPNSIFVRNNLQEKRAIAILYRGETFDIYDSVRQSNGALWYYGFAWGGENKWGWVYQYWVTNSQSLCPDGQGA